GGQVAVWAQLDPGVASFDYFIQEAVPRDLLRVIGEPDAPGIRCGSDAQARVFTGDGGGFGMRRYRGGHCCSLLCGQSDYPRSGRWKAGCLRYSSQAVLVDSRVPVAETATPRQPAP